MQAASWTRTEATAPRSMPAASWIRTVRSPSSGALPAPFGLLNRRGPSLFLVSATSGIIVRILADVFTREGVVKRHPTDLRLEAFLLDQGDETRAILLHLCDCERCRKRLKSGPPRRPGGLPGSESIPPTPPLPRDHRTLGFAAALAQERFEAPELFVELLRRPVGARVGLVVSDPRFRTWGVLELLIERSLATATRDAEEAEALAALALLLVDQLDVGFYGPESLEDLRARAWGHLANARRVRSDLHGAEQA